MPFHTAFGLAGEIQLTIFLPPAHPVVRASPLRLRVRHSMSAAMRRLGMMCSVITQKFSKHHCVNSAFGQDFKEV